MNTKYIADVSFNKDFSLKVIFKWFLLQMQLYPVTKNILSTGVEDAGMHKISAANLDKFRYIFSILTQ